MSDLTVSPGSVRVARARRVSFAEWGEAGATPVFYLHGAIGSPLSCSPELEDAVRTLDLRLVAVQRPGFGGSDTQPGRTLLDAAQDVAAVADALGIGRFGVVGVSAGGPYAVACAKALGDRLTAAAAVSSLSPLCPPALVPGLPARVRIPLRCIAAAPRLTARLGDLAVGLVRRHPGALSRAMTLGASPADKASLACPGIGRAAAGAFLEAARHGVGGMIEDHLVTSRSWGFALNEVPGEVHVWHGARDAFVPVEHALQLASALPRCRVSLDPFEGHFFFRRRAAEILGALSSPAPGAGELFAATSR